MFWRRKRSEQDFADEIRAHLELEEQQLRREGLGDAARTAARRHFGNAASVHERYYEKRHWPAADTLARDVRYAFRLLRKSPGFTAVAILVLTLAIGSNLAVFDLVDAILLRSIPVAHPEQLVDIRSVNRQGEAGGMLSPVLEPLRKERIFAGVCGFTTPRFTTLINGAVASTGTLMMTPDCFDTLGIQPQIGRVFTQAEDSYDAPGVVLITDALWRTAFGGRRDVLGKEVQAEGELYTIIGVARPLFSGVLLGFPPGLILPLHQMPGEAARKRHVYFWVSILARRAPGVTQAQVAARIGAIARPLLEQSMPLRYNAAQRRDYLARRIAVSSGRTGVDWMLRDRFGKPLYALWGICGAVLLIACVNLASLLLARTVARRKEIAVRVAIGASRWRVARPLVLECLMLTLTGAAAGAVFARLACRLIVSQAAAVFANFSVETAFGWPEFALLGGLVAAITLAFAAVPAWHAGRFQAGALKEVGRGVLGAGTRGQRMLIAAQMAFTLALVTAGGLFASSFHSLETLYLGVETRGVSEAMLSPLPGGYSSTDSKPYYRELLDRVRALPDVASASLSSFALYWHRPYPELVTAEDGGAHSGEMHAASIRATEDYFATLGIRLSAGRNFAIDDAEPEAIVSESVARQSGGAALIGHYIRVGDPGAAQRVRVIGIVPSIRLNFVDPRISAPLAVYLNFWQYPAERRYPTLLVQTHSGSPVSGRALQSAVQGLGREYVEEYRTLDEVRDSSLVEDRALAYLATAFAGLALALAATGLFGLLSCYVAGRAGEIGIRMALGAGGAEIRALVVRQMIPVIAPGAALGLALALVAGRLMAGNVYGVAPHDPRLLLVSLLILAGTAAAAAWIPARRAASVEPVDALREG